jgi:hypothetical protein
MNQLATRIEPSALGVLNRSEIDGQIATARQFPRDLERFDDKVRSLATRSTEIAAECLYGIPRDGKVIEGPSVRFAEILVANFGNCRVGARIIEEAEDHVVAQGIFHDLESNAITTFETRRRIIDKYGRRYKPDMVNVTCNAACAVALRQAVLKGIPKPFWEGLYAAARIKAQGEVKDLPRLRQAAVKGFAAYGIDETRICRAIGVDGIEAIDGEGIAKLRGIYQSIKEGELTVAEAFPAEQPTAKNAAPISTLADFAAPPAEDSAPDAYEAGRTAFEKGAKIDQWPAKYEKNQPLIDAWVAGWKSANEEAP